MTTMEPAGHTHTHTHTHTRLLSTPELETDQEQASTSSSTANQQAAAASASASTSNSSASWLQLGLPHSEGENEAALMLDLNLGGGIPDKMPPPPPLPPSHYYNMSSPTFHPLPMIPPSFSNLHLHHHHHHHPFSDHSHLHMDMSGRWGSSYTHDHLPPPPPSPFLSAPSSSSDFRLMQYPLHLPRPLPRRPPPAIWFVLQASLHQSREPVLPQLSKSFLRIKDGRMTVRLVMKYVANKLGLRNESQVEIRCREQVLEPFLTLQHVRDQIWSRSDAVILLPNSSTSPHLMLLQYGSTSSSST